ncbi:UNVERIFIED_ORG: P4 family phage/plasmid primase-like protein [Arthrobacter sp. UYEF2]
MKFAQALWGRQGWTVGEGEIALWFGERGPKAVAVDVADLEGFAKAAAAHEDAELAYVGISPRVPGTVKGHSHGGDASLLPARYIFLDIDTGKEGYPADKEAAMALILAFHVKPHVLVETAHGYHVYYLLLSPLDSPELLSLPYRFESAFAAHLAQTGHKMDMGVTTQTTRLGRIPGTWNRKKDLLKPVRTELFAISDHALLDPDELLASLPEVTGISVSRDGALPLVYDERAGAELARELPISQILEEVHGWEVLQETAAGVELWDAHCAAAASDVNARSVWGVRQVSGHPARTDDRAQAVYVYSSTTAEEYGVPASTRLTSFTWIAHRWFGGDYRNAAGLAAAFSGRAVELLAVLKTDPTPATIADLARQASAVWPADLSTSHAGYLIYRGVAPDVATARGYSSLTLTEAVAAVDPDLVHARVVKAIIDHSGSVLKAPVCSIGGGSGSTLRLDGPMTVDFGGSFTIYQSVGGLGYARSVLDMNPLARPWAATDSVPLIVTAADLRGPARPGRDEPGVAAPVQHGQVHADALLSAALREGFEAAVVSLASWNSGMHLPGSAATGHTRTSKLRQDWNRLALDGRSIFLVGRSKWRQSEGLIPLAQLLEAKGATVFVVDTPAPEAGPAAAGYDLSPYAASDYLAEQAVKGNAKPLAQLLAAALPLEEAAWQSRPMPDTEVGRAVRLREELLRSRSYRYNATDKVWMRNEGAFWHGSPAANPSAHAVRVFEQAGADLTGIAAVKRPVEFVAVQPGIATETGTMGTKPRELNVLNGVVDLATGRLRERTADDLHLTVSPVAYDPTAGAPTWMKFLEQITLGDAELQGYLQRLAGQCSVGEVISEMLFFFYGHGGNGKSVFVGPLSELFAGYATVIPTEMLTGKPAPHQIADLYGKRMAVGSETDEGERISGAALKELAKRDGLRGAKKFGHAFDFQASHTPIIMTNHKPTISATDRGTWRRIDLVPFDLQLTDDQMDKTLPAKLRNELPGILNWVVAGAVQFLATGLGTCSKVQSATETYREEQDVLGRFLRDEWHVTGNRKDRAPRPEFHGILNAWLTSDEAGLTKGWTAKAIADKLSTKGVTVARSSSGEVYCGLKKGPAPFSEGEIDAIVAENPVPDELPAVEVLAPVSVSAAVAPIPVPAAVVDRATLLADALASSDDEDEEL